MRDLTLLTYADAHYASAQALLVNRAENMGAFDHIVARTRADLIATDFYKTNRDVLDRCEGGGFCLWKPFLIRRELKEMRDGDLLLYVDAGDWLEGAGSDLRKTVAEVLQHEDVYLTSGSFRNGDWTKRDTFVRMGCDSPPYHDAIQVEAGVCAFRASSSSRIAVGMWLGACEDADSLTSDENVMGRPNLPGFREHRYDQSILTNLAVRFGWPQGSALRPFVHCNRNLQGIA